MPSRVLLVEDDAALGTQIVDRLCAAGYEALWWREGRRIFDGDLRNIDLLILDLMLPGAHGLDMLRDLRRDHDVPVLILSGRNDTSDRVRALQLGADDYMTKPFWPEELIERVRARLRRPSLVRGNVLSRGRLRIDRETRVVQVDGKPIEVTRLEFELLSALAERPGAALTRAALIARVADEESDAAERNLDAHVSRLRKKLGAGSFIETVWGIGYRLSTKGST